MGKSELNIGLLGGTFDPPHIAHLRIAEETREAFQLDEIWFIPAGYPPHKARPEAPYENRLEMLKISIKDNPFFKCLDLEREEKPSYTLKTLEKLHFLYPHYKFYLLLGWD
ncbi:MAG: nicotinate-nicotinamide nucleotide adenylyltransferase, partial [Caldimicrobium sp.]